MLVEEVDPAIEDIAGFERDGVEDAAEEAVGWGVGVEAFIEVELGEDSCGGVGVLGQPEDDAVNLSGDRSENEAGVVSEEVEGAMQVAFADGMEFGDDRSDLGWGEAGEEGAVGEEVVAQRNSGIQAAWGVSLRPRARTTPRRVERRGSPVGERAL